MNEIIFKTMGGLVLLLAGGLLCMGVLVLVIRSPRFALLGSTAFFIRLIAVVVTLAVVGFGLLRLRKWAALLFSILTLCLAVLGVEAAIHPVASRPGDANWLGFVYAALFITPTILTVRCWRILSWHKRQGEGAKL